MMLYISMKFHENILNGFQVIEWTQLHDGRTDIRGKNNMSPPLSGGDINISKCCLLKSLPTVLRV